ncbi:MAG: hypothetical protein IKO22_07750 [Oscillospiraceae bacterium]|nr:hypothetical protein [Oscillospiraceae bacterium]
MELVRISDSTMRLLALRGDSPLTFKGKLEIAKYLDKLGVSAIELEGLNGSRADALRVKSICSAVKGSVVAVPVELTEESVDAVWEALKGAAHPRLQVIAPVSTVQMEYISRKKPDAMLECIRGVVSACAAKTGDVEFLAADATRSEPAFLRTALKTAIAAGAKTVTVCDAAGTMLPDEFAAFIRALFADIPALRDVTVGASCVNTLSMADACAVAAIHAGVREVKVSAACPDTASLQTVAGILAVRDDLLQVRSSLHTVELRRIVRQIVWLCQTKRSKNSPFDDGVQDKAPELSLALGDDVEAVLKCAGKLGYDLSQEDAQAVWEAVQEVLRHKEQVDARELDAVIASVAMQVPPTYQVESYLINSGNNISALAHLKLSRGGQTTEGVALGDGPIDAAFMAIEQIIHHHYELDDFQIRAVTEGHEAMGETVVRLVSNGKLYSGRGISTDIVGSSIQAYVNALNKIAYEEAEQ